ncbi:hypothetical protein A8U91_03357 [Halomonas elongata]|uniref:Uncharacterized protein n=1 Tax=Halomonas elongata TaxID=2746 RepID=A0A1B8NWC1_HALEL|nr:hypothetical protein A8U91_03357 [Halomonas elongata]
MALHTIPQPFQLIFTNLVILENHLIKSFKIVRSDLFEVTSRHGFIMKCVTNINPCANSRDRRLLNPPHNLRGGHNEKTWKNHTEVGALFRLTYTFESSI